MLISIAKRYIDITYNVQMSSQCQFIISPMIRSPTSLESHTSFSINLYYTKPTPKLTPNTNSSNIAFHEFPLQHICYQTYWQHPSFPGIPPSPRHLTKPYKHLYKASAVDVKCMSTFTPISSLSLPDRACHLCLHQCKLSPLYVLSRPYPLSFLSYESTLVTMSEWCPP